MFDIKEGELIIVPRGVEHKPICEEECCVILIEPKETVNTGSAGGEVRYRTGMDLILVGKIKP